jgi:hypothetical protein
MEDGEQLRKLVGQIVEIDGTLGDEGGNAGQFPEILVQRLSPRGEGCRRETKN